MVVDEKEGELRPTEKEVCESKGEGEGEEGGEGTTSTTLRCSTRSSLSPNLRSLASVVRSGERKNDS